VKNWPQKVLISAKRLDRPSRLRALEERDSDVMVAMTRPAVFTRGLCRVRSAFSGADRQLWPHLLKEGFNCRDLPRAWCLPRNDPW
jgi:hypothetical protein